MKPEDKTIIEAYVALGGTKKFAEAFVFTHSISALKELVQMIAKFAYSKECGKSKDRLNTFIMGCEAMHDKTMSMMYQEDMR